MKATIISVSNETDNFNHNDLEKIKTLSGKNAGICYQKEGFFNTYVSDNEKANKRFAKVANTGHHSIADHVMVEVIFENISKMLAIVLNSLQYYSTSEKSGRYTTMTGNSDKEKELYNKWVIIFQKQILKTYPDIDDMFLSKELSKLGYNNKVKNGMSDENIKELNDIKEISKSLPSYKLAQENARYILSVFTKSTTMGYTTSLRQWNYIYDWCLKYINNYYIKDDKLLNKNSNAECTFFEKEMYKDFDELSKFIKENLYVEELRDFKNNSFDFLNCKYSDKYQINIPEYKYSYFDKYKFSKNDILADSYTISYPSSFVSIAQAQRHRTLKYFMKFDPNKELTFYVPSIIANTELEKEWLQDLKSVEQNIPQATIIGIIETGHIMNFVLKCKERLCGRAQYEIMMQTKISAERFYEESNKEDSLLTEAGKEIISELFNENKLNEKCNLINTCKEPCYFGAKNSLNRLI